MVKTFFLFFIILANTVWANPQCEKDLSPKRNIASLAMGYSKVIVVMASTAAATGYLSSQVPKEWHVYVDPFITAVAVMGIQQFGAPIWDRLRSWIRLSAFEGGTTKSPPSLEARWLPNQRISQNAQWVRIQLIPFLQFATTAFDRAHTAMMGDPTDSRKRMYAADKIALVAYWMHKIYPDLDFRDAELVDSIHSSFTNHVSDPASLVPEVLRAIQRIGTKNGDWTEESEQAFFIPLIKNWLELQN